MSLGDLLFLFCCEETNRITQAQFYSIGIDFYITALVSNNDAG